MTTLSSAPAAVDSTPEELDSVLGAAARAAQGLAASAPADRAAWLRAVADALDAAGEQLIPIAAEESSLALPRLTGELRRTTFQLRLFAELLGDGSFLQATIDHADPAWGMGPRPDLRRALRPLGPAAVFAASNFPFAFSVAGGDTAAALAAGCPVVVKTHPGHPRLSAATAVVVTETLAAAGAPEGTFAVVSGVDVGRSLISDPRIRVASFTGSFRGGQALAALAAARPDPIPFFGELGSVNPTFVTPGAAAARPDDIAAGFVASMTLGAGQFCTKPGVLFIPAGTDLPQRIVARLALVPAVPLLNQAIFDGYGSTVATLAARPGVRTLLAADPAAGRSVAASLFGTSVQDFVSDREAMTEECFGPAALVVEYGSADELLDAARAFAGELTATVHGDVEEPVIPLLLDLLAERAGRVLWNGWPTGVSVTHAMQHGGPFPATTAPQHTSVGTASIDRFLRPVSYQDIPDALLPPPLRDANPWSVPQRIDGTLITRGIRGRSATVVGVPADRGDREPEQQ